MELKSFLSQCALHDTMLSLSDHRHATEKFKLSYREVESVALEMGIVPLRYQRNQSTISPAQQKILFDSHVFIIGCGGLGGHIAEILTRIGIGKLSLFDFDYFEEHNLNRQNFSTLADLGREKALVVKEGLERINPSIEIQSFVQKFDPNREKQQIKDATVVIDAIDNPQTKLEIAKVCQEVETHFVHGAIAGMQGQFTTNSTLEYLYPDGERGAEMVSGNPAFTVTLAASIQASETIKLLLDIGEPLKDTFLVTDLLYNEFEKLPL